MNPAEQVRDYAYRHYILSARAQKKRKVTFTSSEIHKALGFKDRMPCVCDALSTNLFKAKHGIVLVDKTGPKHGASTTFTFSV